MVNPLPTYHLFGLRIRSEVPLPGPVTAGDGWDVQIAIDEARPVPAEQPVGRRLAGLVVGERTLHTAVEEREGYRFRFHDLCDVAVSRDLKHVAVSPDPGCDGGMIQILVAGNVLALLLTITGLEVLHGSAVEIEGRTVAFLGHSGAGKSTLAGEACAAGARLVSDDVVAIERADGRVRCLRGGSSLRLRAGVAELAERLSPLGAPTSDGRTAIVVEPPASERPELAALVLPRVAAELSEPGLDRLQPDEAFLSLNALHRLAGLTDPAAVGRHFHACGDLVGLVPVFVLAVKSGDAARGAALATGPEVLEAGAAAR